MADEVAKAGADAGVDELLLELVKIRASQINGCAFCLDMHTADALRHGEDARRLFLLDAWHETELFTEQERAALEMTEVLTRLSENRDLPDDVYERVTSVLDENQYKVVAWMIVVINSFNRLGVPSHSALPKRTS